MQGNSFIVRLGVAIAFVLSLGFGALVSRAMRVPADVGFDASLLHQPNPIVAILTIGVLVLATSAATALLLGRWRREVGLFCAAGALAGVSLRGGSIVPTLQYAAGGAGAFLLLALELVILYALLAAGAYVAELLRPKSPVAYAPDPADDEQGGLNHTLLAVAVQAVTLTVVMLIFGQTEAKKQALATVAIGSYLGAIISHYSFPLRDGRWLGVAPLVVGLLGYVLEYTKPALLPIGRPDQPLAIALPLDLVAAGVIGGILGHWMSQKWKEESAAAAAEAAPS